MFAEKKRTRCILYLFLTLGLAAIAFVSLSQGKYPISFSDVASIFSGSGNVSEMTANVFFTLRLPRTLMTIISGAGLGLAGCVYQLIFRNPLASPGILGVSGGANFGAALAIITTSASGALAVAVGSFAGGIVAVLCVMLLTAAIRMHSTVSYILSGIIINAVSAALIMTLKYFADPADELASMEYWEMGTFGNITMSKFLVVLPLFAVGFAGIILMRRHIDLMSLNDNEGRSLGLRLKPVRTAVLVLNTLIVSSLVCLTGLISFVGLVAPHISKLILRNSGSGNFALSAITGSIIVSAADIFARTLYSAELPISILTTCVGVPVLIVFLVRNGGQEK